MCISRGGAYCKDEEDRKCAFCIDLKQQQRLTKKRKLLFTAAVLLLYSVSFQIENDSMATPMKAAIQLWDAALLCHHYAIVAPIHSCSFEKIFFLSSFHVDNLLCLLLKACYSIMMSIWMYELVQKTLANAETPLLAHVMRAEPRKKSPKIMMNKKLVNRASVSSSNSTTCHSKVHQKLF